MLWNVKRVPMKSSRVLEISLTWAKTIAALAVFVPVLYFVAPVAFQFDLFEVWKVAFLSVWGLLGGVFVSWPTYLIFNIDWEHEGDLM